MTRNMGSVDRVIRVIVGLVLIALYFVYPAASWRWLFLLGIIPLLTGLVGWCGLYSLLGINSCPRR
ncbi:MAG TPA: DUF2892 domain-containing protein [Paracoccus sp. (in: a-proteobacteria)]|nr:DUF2892 domain-containing protein [Paracoccus sp. (in: a-proteobacteria)]